jgi:4-phytase/acid phosphatase
MILMKTDPADLSPPMREARGRWRDAALLIALLCLAAGPLQARTAPPAPRLERVVILMRHGVRPPTKSAAALAPLADHTWPGDDAWGAAPGELTPHGVAAIRLQAARLRHAYADLGLIPAEGSIASQILIWADSADQRTRETAKALAQGLSPITPLETASRPAGEPDPLFDSLGVAGCALDPDQALAAVKARGPLETAQTVAATARLQAILAPKACAGGAGACLAGLSKLSADERGVKISGPLATAATVSEDLLLEYENGLPMDQVGWGRLAAGDLDGVLAAQARSSDLTRATPYIGVRRGGLLARFILAALTDQPTAPGAPGVRADQRLIILVGHDTNLSNIAGAFGLSWTLPGQPDPTAPGTALAFERWRDPATGQALLRVRVFYQTPDQVRGLEPAASPPVVVSPGSCPVGGTCRLEDVAATMQARLPAQCR